MPIISSCPKCRQPVTIPDGVAPDAEVRCPLCAAAYPLSQAMTGLPPALIPVDTAASAGRAADADAAAKPDSESQGDRAPQPAAADSTPSPGGAAPAIDTGRTPVDAEAFTGFGPGQPQNHYEPIAAELPSHRHRRKKEKSGIRFLVEVFGGGFLGLAIGYYIACWAGLQMPKFPLPWLPHTMHWFADKQPPEDGAPDVPKGRPQGDPPSAPPRPNPNGTVAPETTPAATPNTVPKPQPAEPETEPNAKIPTA